jgi:protein-export membrane protein SecD
MTRADQWKMAAVVAVTLLSLWYLWPSYRYYSMPAEQRSQLAPTEVGKLRDQAIHLGLDLQGGLHLVMEVDRSRLGPEEAKDAVDRAIEIIRNRIDEFGVAEPLIQKQGEDRIVVQLPGLTDLERAKELIGQTALLEFKLVRTPGEAQLLFDRLDSFLASSPAAATMDSAMRMKPLTSQFLALDNASFVANEELAVVQKLLETPGLDAALPPDSELRWGEPNQGMQGRSGRMLYVLKRVPEMTGGSVANAVAKIGLNQQNPGSWGVSMTLNPRGRSDFARVTGANTGRQLAIVLDGTVRSAPVIQERIPTGDASITGSFDVAEARDLAIVLRAGALPAPVSIIEERSVGPSLGQDSIKQGLTASWIATVLVVLFMVVYYRLSGAIAIAALALNVLYVIATLAGFGATLTLPGIAGVALSIGMAVDANVLIFERIREELRNQKSVRQSVDLGYDRAFRTIFDSNLTVILCCVFLFQFGTGPIKGFAVTMIIGLVANVFTAVLFTRMIYDSMLSRGPVERLSI